MPLQDANPTPSFGGFGLRRYYPLEFFVTLMNNQPMGFYPLTPSRRMRSGSAYPS